MLNKLLSTFRQKRFYGAMAMPFTSSLLQWKTKDYLQSYADSVYVYACVRKRAEKTGQINFELYRGDDRIESDPILDLLYRPNRMQSKNEFFELYQIYKDLAGSTYIFVVRQGNKPVEMYNLRPDWITEKRSKDTGELLGYEYKAGQKTTHFKVEDIIASYYPSPLSQQGGHSPIQTGARVIDTQIQLENYHANVMRNGGRVEGIINVKTDYLSEDQIKELQKQFKEKHAGAMKAGTPFFTYGDMEYTNLGLTPSDLSFIDSKKFTRADILSIFGVPLQLIDTSDTGSLGQNGYEAALQMFLGETIKPLHDNIVQKLNEFLVPDELDLRYVDPSPQNVELTLKEIESGVKNYYMTINEARERAGLTPFADGDKLLLPFNLIEQPTREKSVKKKSQFEHPLRDKAFREAYYKDYRAGLEQEINIFRQVLRQYIESQKERVVGNDKKNFVADRFNLGLENEIGITIFTPILERMFKDSGQQIFDLFGGDTFSMKPQYRESLEKRAEFFVNEINQTTFNEMQDVFDQAQIDGLTRAELIEQVEDLYDNRIETSRAEAIVRTETHHAIEEAKLEGYRQMRIPIKIWVHNPVSAEPRIDHMAIDGEEQPIDNVFSNGLMYPGDGGPEDSINCNCTL